MNFFPDFTSEWSEFIDINADITSRLYRESTVSNLVGFILAILLAVALLQINKQSTSIYVWLGVMTLTYLARTKLTASYKKKVSPDLSWLYRFRFSVFITSLVWSSVCFLLFRSHDIVNQAIISFTLTGLCTGAAMSYPIDLVVLFGFLFPVILSLLIRLLIEGTPTSIAMSLMLLLYLIFVVASGRRTHKALHEKIDLAATSLLSEEREKANYIIMEMLAKKTPLSQILEMIVRNLEKQNKEILCSILLLDREGKHLQHGAAPSLPDFYNNAINGLAIGDGVGSCGTTSYSGKRVIVEDIQTHPYWSEFKELAAKANLAACWSEPIKDSNGKILGSFAIYHRKPICPSEKDIQTIVPNANLAGIAIELAHLNQELKLAAMLYQNSNESVMVTDANNLIVAVNPAFTEATGYCAEEAIGRDPKMLRSGRHDELFYQELWQQINALGNWQGEFWNSRKNGEIYAEWVRINTIFNNDGSVLNRVSHAVDITKKKEFEDTIWKQANFDALTGLPNRHMFHDRFLQEIKKTHRADLPLALMFIDLDNFKEVNDALGHYMGDLLLKEAGRRLVSCVRDSDTVAHMNAVARIGGDEFTIVLGELKDTDCIELIAQRVLNQLSDPFYLNEEIAYVSASVGITLYPTDSTNAETLIKNADLAMYAAKKQGRNQFCFFNESMQLTAQNRMRLTKDLREALEKQQFHLVYQPIVDLATRKISKAEALIRWQHPTIGLIGPVEFISIAEDTGIILEIGNWVFQEVVGQVTQWRESLDPDFQISINKSPAEFLNLNANKENKYQNWAMFMQKLNLPGQSIAIEITEGLLLDSNSSIHSQLKEFVDAGIQISLDDFGTGYSSLSYLKKFDIDYIKIDQSFVQNLETQSDDMALCEAIIVMAHKLNMKVVAEGIETQLQLDLLQGAGCDFGQGYFFSKPISVKEFENFVEQHNTSVRQICV